MSSRLLFRPSLLLSAALLAAAFAPSSSAQTRWTASAQAGSGLQIGDDASWPRWQTRLDVLAGRYDPGWAPGGDPARRPTLGLSLFGDYYFLQQGDAAEPGYTGGFRATGGILVTPRASASTALSGGAIAWGNGLGAQQRSFSLFAAADTNETMPYLGVGYTGLKSLRATGGGWGFSADVGLIALRPRSAVRLGTPGSFDVTRDLQLSPLLQVGASYSF